MCACRLKFLATRIDALPLFAALRSSLDACSKARARNPLQPSMLASTNVSRVRLRIDRRAQRMHMLHRSARFARRAERTTVRSPRAARCSPLLHIVRKNTPCSIRNFYRRFFAARGQHTASTMERSARTQKSSFARRCSRARS